jgi:hypothetical protein
MRKEDRNEMCRKVRVFGGGGVSIGTKFLLAGTVTFEKVGHMYTIQKGKGK